MDYQVLPKTRLGFEGVAGVINSWDTPLQYLQQGLMRVSYNPTGKLTFFFSGGVQFLEFEGRIRLRLIPSLASGSVISRSVQPSSTWSASEMLSAQAGRRTRLFCHRFRTQYLATILSESCCNGQLWLRK